MPRYTTLVCTCDDNCDSPCPAHARENQLQDELIKLQTEVQGNLAIERVITEKEIAVWLISQVVHWPEMPISGFNSLASNIIAGTYRKRQVRENNEP